MRGSAASVRALSTSARPRSAVTRPRAVTSSTAMVNPPGVSRHLRNGVDVKLGSLPPGVQRRCGADRLQWSLPLSGRWGHNGAMAGAWNRVARAFAVLEAFTSASPALTLSEIVPRTGLCGAGALEREGDGSYRVGLRLWEIASLAPRGVPLREAALPFLEDLYEVTHENAQLGVREGQDAGYIERFAGRRAVGVLTRVGGRFPLHASGIGLVLLAHAPEQVQREVLAGSLERFTDHTITDPARLARVLAEVRRDGVAISDRQVTDDAMSVAAPVTDATGEVIAALS